MRVILSIIFLCLSAISASAWNWEGHEVVALIAEDHLSPKARSEVQRLLSEEGKASMAEVANWADNVKTLNVPGQPMHTVRLPLNRTAYKEDRDCRKQTCAVVAIQNCIEVLKKARLNDDAKLLALKYLIHLIADIHQPLHASVDLGERKVIVHHRIRALHFIWDNQIIANQRKSPSELKTLILRDQRTLSLAGTVIDWATESRDIARDHLFANLTEPDASGITALADSYADDNWPIVEDRLELAGLRLAVVLNRVLSTPVN
jgi:hypothetical protein